MRLNPTEKRLFEAFSDIKVIDSHEHLAPEKERTSKNVDLTFLFAWPYTATDIISAGMPRSSYAVVPSLNELYKTDIPLRERWKMIAPYLGKIRYGSYARAIYSSVKEFYGFDDINEQNYEAISEEMVKANKPGIYHRVLREKCNIQTALTQAHRTDFDLDLLVPLMPGVVWGTGWGNPRSQKDIEARSQEIGGSIRKLDDYISLMEERLKRWKAEGVVGIKIMARSLPETSREKASELFNEILQNPETTLPELNPLQTYLVDRMMEICAELDLVVAVHTGMWGDFRALNPTYVIPLLMKHPNVRFDIYHAGIPYVRETALIGKNWANAWLDLCWSHIISPQMTMSALDEWIDLVPVNKIIAFGGDYGTFCVECIYGHLVIARENIARVLGRRVDDGLMTMNEAVSLAEDWFYNIPKALYRLK